MEFHNNLEPKIWGPHYWFFLHTITFTYPNNPNDIIKKKYYELIQNMPLFIPNKKISNELIKILDKYPITPYLDSRISFQKWMHFIHNKINQKIGNKIISFTEFNNQYIQRYKPQKNIQFQKLKKKERIASIFIITCILSIIYYFIHKK